MMIRVICGSSRSSCSFIFSIMKPLFPYMVLLYLTLLHVSTEILCRLGSFSSFPAFPPINLLPITFRLGDFPGFPAFPPTSLPPYGFRLGSFSSFPTFPPTCLLPYGFRLGDFPGFPTFPPACLLPRQKSIRKRAGISRRVLRGRRIGL